MKFDIWTFLFQIINFIVLLFILKRILYKPVKEIMEKRRGLIEKTVEDAERTKKEALELKEKYQGEMNNLKELQIRMTESMKNEVEEEKNKLLMEAEKEAAKIIEKEKALFDTEKMRFEIESKDKVINAVSVFAINLLKDISDEELHKGIFRKFLSELGGTALNITPMEGESVTVDLISAYPVEEEKLTALRKAIESHLSKKVAVNAQIDKTLIAGLKIKVNDMVYDSSLLGQINSITSRLKETA